MPRCILYRTTQDLMLRYDRAEADRVFRAYRDDFRDGTVAEAIRAVEEDAPPFAQFF